MGQNFATRPVDPDRKRVSDEAYRRVVRHALAMLIVGVPLLTLGAILWMRGA